MAARPGGKGPTLYEVAGWLQGVVAAPFRALGWLLRKDVTAPAIPRWAAIPPRWRWAIVLILGLVAGSTLLFALYLWFHVLLVAVGWTPSEKAWDDIRFGLLIVAGVLSAPFVVWRTMIADRQTIINQQTHYTDLYTKAVEMLGADKVVKERVEISPAIEDKPAVYETAETTVPNIEVRLGAIYALQRIMNQSDDDYLPILKTLCVYVRTYVDKPKHLFFENDPFGGRERTEEDDYHAEEAIDYLQYNAKFGNPNAFARPDIRAALDVITQRRADPKFTKLLIPLAQVAPRC